MRNQQLQDCIIKEPRLKDFFKQELEYNQVQFGALMMGAVCKSKGTELQPIWAQLGTWNKLMDCQSHFYAQMF